MAGPSDAAASQLPEPSLDHFPAPSERRFHLQLLLDHKEKQLQQAGTLGQCVLAQQAELEEKIRQIQDFDAEHEDEDLDTEARERYRELVDTIKAWNVENAQLARAFGPKAEDTRSDLPRDEPERSKTYSSSAAQSRRAKNAAHRADDVEFAFEIGSGLLTEVRRIQSLLAERDKAIQDMKEEKDDLERSIESLRSALRSQEQSSDKFKEENWNLEVTLQELRTQLSDFQSAVLRLESEHKRLTKLLNTARESADQHKSEAERTKTAFDEFKAKHDTEFVAVTSTLVMDQAGGTTDPSIIHAITQTMIGEFLYKYTRRAILKGHGEKRHKRFFWVHPYTNTLYWSSADPGSSNVLESSAKSSYIEGVRSILDPNPMPPGLCQYSVVISTAQREMKITAPSKERHDIWLNALKYLLARPNPTLVPPQNQNSTSVTSPMPHSVEFTDDGHRLVTESSPQSPRSGRSSHNGGGFNTTPRGARRRSQLSVKGTLGKRVGTPAVEYLRWAAPESPYSPSRSFEQVTSGNVEHEDELEFELHDDTQSYDGFEGLGSVRACCDGLHTVGHQHHPHPHAHSRHERLDLNLPARPVSSAWSLRSRSRSAHKAGGLFL